MRTRTRVDTVYNLEDLDEAAQEKAHEAWANEIYECGWVSESINDTFHYYLEERGMPTDDLEWSLSWSQGDGVAFYGTIDIEKYLRFTKQWSKFSHLWRSFDISASSSRNSWAHHYSHYNTMTVDLEPYYDKDPTEKQAALIKELDDLLSEAVKDISHELEKMGYAEIEYQTSFEAFKDSCEANEYEFTEEGKWA